MIFRHFRLLFVFLLLGCCARAQFTPAPAPPGAKPPAPVPPTPPGTKPGATPAGPVAHPDKIFPPAILAPGYKPSPPPANLSPKELEKYQDRVKNRKLAEDFFNGPIVRLEIDLTPEQWAKLKKSDREYAEATITEVTRDNKRIVHPKASVKLKGSAGSSRGIDDKPGLTVSFSKLKGERFHGLKKFHLNNGVQDGSLLNEYLSGEMCRAAGVVASRCTHAFVKWQGRDMGIYVFKETFNEDMFSYFYEDVDGSLYDGHFISEVDTNMEKQEGDKNDTSDLKALAAACKEPDQKLRWKKLGEVLDVQAYLRFFAMETFTSHWDGYNFNKNNFRVYFDATNKKGYFFCHGMDQTWGNPNFSILHDPVSIVGLAVMENPEWRQQYRKVTEDIYARVISSREWDGKLQRQGDKVQDALTKWVNPKAGRDFQQNINNMRERFKARIAGIVHQFPKPLGSTSTIVALGPRGWHPDGTGTLDEVADGGQKSFHVTTDGKTPGAWKCGIILPAGTYRFQTKVKVANVAGKATAFGDGAGLRISGASRVNKNGFTGTANWQPIVYEFDTPGGEVVFMAELCSAQGDAWFSRAALTLTKIK